MEAVQIVRRDPDGIDAEKSLVLALGGSLYVDKMGNIFAVAETFPTKLVSPSAKLFRVERIPDGWTLL